MANMWLIFNYTFIKPFDKLLSKRNVSFTKILFISFQWWTKETILRLVNLILSCIMLEGKSKQNKAKQEKN